MKYGRCERCSKAAAKAYRFSWTGPKGAAYVADYATCSQACAIDLAKSESQLPYKPPHFPTGSKLRELIGADAVVVLTANAPLITSEI